MTWRPALGNSASARSRTSCRRDFAWLRCKRGGAGLRCPKLQAGLLRIQTAERNFCPTSSGFVEYQAIPDIDERFDEMVDVGVGVDGRRCKPQALRSARDGRVVDWLYVDAMSFDKVFTHLLATLRIANEHRHDVARRLHCWQMRFGEAALQQAG